MNEEQKIEHLIDQARDLAEEVHGLRDSLDQWYAKLADLLMNLINLRVYLREEEQDED